VEGRALEAFSLIHSTSRGTAVLPVVVEAQTKLPFTWSRGRGRSGRARHRPTPGASASRLLEIGVGERFEAHKTPVHPESAISRIREGSSVTSSVTAALQIFREGGSPGRAGAGSRAGSYCGRIARHPARPRHSPGSYLTTTSLIATRGCTTLRLLLTLSTDGLQMPTGRDVEQIVRSSRPTDSLMAFHRHNLGSGRLPAPALPGDPALSERSGARRSRWT